MEAKCGCLKKDGTTLAMCPMHLAAPQMREALEHIGLHPCSDDSDGDCGECLTCTARSALRAANGETTEKE